MLVLEIGRRGHSEFGHHQARRQFSNEFAHCVTLVGPIPVESADVLAPVCQLVKSSCTGRFRRLELMPVWQWDEVTGRIVERFIAAIADLCTSGVDQIVSILVPFRRVVLSLGIPDSELFESCRLIGIEHGESLHHEEAVLHLIASFINLFSLDLFEEHDLRPLLAFADAGSALFDLIEGAPSLRVETALHGGDLKKKLIDSPIGVPVLMEVCNPFAFGSSLHGFRHGAGHHSGGRR